MTALLDHVQSPSDPEPAPGASGGSQKNQGWLKQPLWNRFTPLQVLVLALASIAPVITGATIVAGVVGIISIPTMVTVALEAGEDPGLIIFGAMFLASPVQRWTGRSQVRVRKYLGIVFYLLALSNGAMFLVESGSFADGTIAAFGSPFLIAGTVALALGLPLFLTSSQQSQRLMGMHRWRLLHKATYLIAVALLAHLVLMPELAVGSVLIIVGFVARIPMVRRWTTKNRRS